MDSSQGNIILSWFGNLYNQVHLSDINFSVTTIIDIAIVALIFYWLYLLLRQTRAIRILYGIAFLVLLWTISQLLQLETLNYLLRLISAAVVVAIPVVFQPELRAGLERLGRTQFVKEFSRLRRSDVVDIVKKVKDATEVMAHQKTGAIIVIARRTGLREYIENGIKVEANISPELILSIFSPESAMHDGAIIIQGNKIVAAKVILPLSDNKFDYRLGTRHRAAVGVTALTDAVAIVVSQERGEISISVDGLLESGIATDTLEKILLSHLTSNTKK